MNYTILLYHFSSETKNGNILKISKIKIPDLQFYTVQKYKNEIKF